MGTLPSSFGYAHYAASAAQNTTVAEALAYLRSVSDLVSSAQANDDVTPQDDVATRTGGRLHRSIRLD